VNLSPYRELAFDDQDGWQEFLARHEIAHQTIAQALQRAGKSAQRIPLTDDPRRNENWLNDHAAMHSAINKQLGLNNSDIGSQDLKIEEDFVEWMLVHCAMHESENKVLLI
jgi:hypothetical protein